MPLYIPWLTETIKKRGVRYLLHHYLGQFFEEKLTLEQLSIDIYEGKGSIRHLALDVDGLNDELDFIPFKFLDGCLIGQISVEVPWSSLATDACKVELEGAKFVCRLKTSADGTKAHCTESTLLSKSLMTSSMQMAEEIVTTEDDDDYDSPNSSMFKPNQPGRDSSSNTRGGGGKDANQMFEGLEMFAQLIDSVLRRTKLTARNTLFQIQPHRIEDKCDDDKHLGSDTTSDRIPSKSPSDCYSGDEFSEPIGKSETDSGDESDDNGVESQNRNTSDGTVEFFIKFFRCEEMVDQTKADSPSSKFNEANDDDFKKSIGAMPETVTKLLTLEDVEMRIGGTPVSNLIGKHTITIKFNGQKSEISIFSGSPLLAVISHQQLDTFFNVFDNAKEQVNESSLIGDKDQRIMSPEDYAKIENQLLETASLRNMHMNELGGFVGSAGSGTCGPNYISSHVGSGVGGRRWVETGDIYSNSSRPKESDYDYHSPNETSSNVPCLDTQTSNEVEPTLHNIEAFSCELKLPGIWLCILRDGEALPPLIKPYADSINSFQTINKYIDERIKVPHIRFLALKVALDITVNGINIFLGDLDISEYLQDESMMNPKLQLLQNDLSNTPMSTPRYKASIVNNREISIDLLTDTRVVFDPTMIDRIVYDYKLIKITESQTTSGKSTDQQVGKNSYQQRNNQLDFNLNVRGDHFKFELLCPIPDLTPEAHLNRTQLRPQSFLFDFHGMVLTWQSGRLNLSSNELFAYVKTQPKQSDNEAVKFIESSERNNDKILLTLEPSPSNLDNEFPNDIEQALNESSMYDSIYVSQATESRIPTEAFQTKRKVVRASFQSQQTAPNKPDSARISECDHEKILTPGDRQHLLDYLNQTAMSTKLSLSLHLPICEVEFEDKEQLDLIYNRFGNDFVFWHPRAFTSTSKHHEHQHGGKRSKRKNSTGSCLSGSDTKPPKYQQTKGTEDDNNSSGSDDEEGSEVSFHSLSIGGSNSDCFDNEVTCKIIVDELFVKFNHQSCAAALKQEISADNLLLGVVIDVNKKPNTLLSLVADNLELSTDSDVVLEGNTFGDKNSILSLTAEIKRPTRALKDIRLAVQLVNGLFNDFKTETYTRFWQSINVTDEPILGYVAPRIVIELHVDILNTALSFVKDGARPALLSIDELYLTSMVMEQTSQVMIRLIADEVSLYLKRNRQGLEIMKNYICLIDSGLIDLDVKFSHDGRLEFGVINNVITVRVCQDSLNALCKLFNVLIRNSSNKSSTGAQQQQQQTNNNAQLNEGAASNHENDAVDEEPSFEVSKQSSGTRSLSEASNETNNDNNALDDQQKFEKDREMNLLEDAMNDYVHNTSSDSCNRDSSSTTTDAGDRYTTAHKESEGDDHYNNIRQQQQQANEIAYDRDDSPPELNHLVPDDQQHEHEHIMETRRAPDACLLDESNPIIGDLFSQPLMPSSDRHPSSDSKTTMNQSNGSGGSGAESFETTTKPVDESSFFVIGDDDVGAGIIHKQQQEPLIRKLINGPIQIVENHFKMTKPRTIPEMLVNSLERYVLEEMTLVVNLYGGRDFDDENQDDDTQSTSNTTEHDTNELTDTTSMESLSMRSRAGSSASRSNLVAGAGGSRKHCSSDTTNSSLATARRKSGSARRKHLSESGKTDICGRAGTSCPMEPRVRFGEGAVNLWESLDLMSSPDFLGARSRPSQPPLSTDTKIAGGTWRQTDVCIQLTLSKMKLLYETSDGSRSSNSGSSRPMDTGGSSGGPTGINSESAGASAAGLLTGPISWRFMLFIQDIEIKDRIAASDINKMLYEYCTESMPKRSTQILTIKNVATINPSDGCEECDLRVSLKPLRLNIDQDTLLFLIEFFTSFSKALAKQHQQLQQQQQQSISHNLGASGGGGGGGSTSSCGNQRAAGAGGGGKGAAGEDSSAQGAGCSKDSSAAVNGELMHGQAYHRSRAGSSSGGGGGGLDATSHETPASGRRAAKREQSECNSMASSLAASSLSGAGRGHMPPPSGPSSASATSGQASGAGNTTTTTTTMPSAPGETTTLPTHCHTDNASGTANQPHLIYIKSFTFSPDVPIRLDYHAKHLDFEQGALAGILMGLAHLDHSELVLKRVQAKHGMRGLDRVLLFALNSWLSDIKRNQLPSILGGVGPMHSVIQLFQGMRDLIWMPIDHYRKDRRLVRGLQRGASSFSSSTAMAAINLVNRFISIVQCTAQIAHDIVTPPSRVKSLGALGGANGGQSMSNGLRHRSRASHHHSMAGCSSSSSLAGLASVGAGLGANCGGGGGLNQPRNFCEGVAVGFTILKEGFNDTARNVAVGMQAEDMRSAVGELVRQIPSTLLNPIISATEGAQNVLVGIRNQIAPDARREDQEKWKRRVRGK